MAFMKYARAEVVNPFVTREQWKNLRVAGSKASVDLNENLVERAASFFEGPFNPKDYLLTHATIVSSVDVFTPKGFKTGKVLEGGFRVNRRYPDFRVTPETQKYINNNKDCWSRGVLSKSYRTFVGGHNFVEHVQIEDLSKGRLLDAVARDIGESLYVDLLIATALKHAELIEDIKSGKMSTLSMGCVIDGTICTKCGHWASDETEMCPHIKYEKGNVFLDKDGRQHIIAELCGHEDIDPTGGVRFIEASWVATPAFTGAVLRNVLEPSEATNRKAKVILSSPPVQWSKSSRKKAASVSSTLVVGRVSDRTQHFAFEDESEVMPDSEPGESKSESKDPLKTVEEELTKTLTEKVRKRIEDAIKGPDKRPTPEQSSSTNENLQKLASHKTGMMRMYNESLESLARTSSSDAQMVDRIAAYHHGLGLKLSVDVYRTALAVGPVNKYGNNEQFLTSCRKTLGRDLTQVETGVLIRLGKLLSQVG